MLGAPHLLKANGQFTSNQENLQTSEQPSNVLYTRSQPCVKDAAVLVRGKKRMVQYRHQADENPYRGAEKRDIEKRRLDRVNPSSHRSGEKGEDVAHCTVGGMPCSLYAGWEQRGLFVGCFFFAFSIACILILILILLLLLRAGWLIRPIFRLWLIAVT